MRQHGWEVVFIGPNHMSDHMLHIAYLIPVTGHPKMFQSFFGTLQIMKVNFREVTWPNSHLISEILTVPIKNEPSG